MHLVEESRSQLGVRPWLWRTLACLWESESGGQNLGVLFAVTSEFESLLRCADLFRSASIGETVGL